MRFEPDTLLETLLRPVAMVAPDANVYVEIMAPDFRFVFVLAALASMAAMGLLGRGRMAMDITRDGAARRGVFVLLATLVLAFVPWLATTGNGRYFVVGLLVVGPVCVGLVRLLPVTRAMRLTLAGGMVAVQAFAVQQTAPWQAWTKTAWKEPPYFKVEVPPESRSQPATYVTISAISYSLLAPLFHPDSRWISLHNAPAPGSGALLAPRTEAFIAKAQEGRMMLLAPVVPGMLTPERLPNATVSDAIGGQLAAYGLAFTRPQSCRFLASPSLAEMGLGEKTPQQRAESGFWLCHLMRVQAQAAADAVRPARYDAVFKVLETQCPRLFPAGGDHGSQTVPHGEVRSYLQAEMKAYVYDNDEVYYKYYRALNMVFVGKVPEVLAGRARVDCGHVPGRSRLPWQREG